jgi:hypothetical protein
MPNALYIENLPSHEGSAELEQLLKPFGHVRHLTLATDPDMLRRQSGLAVVEMETAAQTCAAIRGLDGKDYQGCTLRARPALTDDALRLKSICRWTLSIHAHPGDTTRCVSEALPPSARSRHRRARRRAHP